MHSRAVSSFWTQYHALPLNVQLQALKQYRLWLRNPRPPSLRFKKVGRYWSARINEDYRAVGVLDGDTIVWFFNGSHDDYEQLIKRV